MRSHLNPGSDGSVSLFIQFRDFWAEVEAVKDAIARGDIDAATARNRLRDALKAQTSAGARRSAPSVASDAQREAQYVMAAVADDVFVQIPSVVGRDWAMHPLELDLFGSRRAGQRVFECVDALLAGDSPNAGELAGIYLAALALGFKGMYADRADGEQKLAEYRDRLRTCLGDRGLGDPLVPQCYEHTMELTPAGLLSGARAWWWGAAAVVGVWLIVSTLLWRRLSGGATMTAPWVGVGIAILAAGAIGIGVALFRRSSYDVPWFLVLGRSDYGRTVLDEVLDEALASTRGFRFGWHYVARQLGLRVWRAENAVVVDVVGSIAFPRGQEDFTGWRRVLRLLQRHRPHRPIDGVILAIPAPLLLDSQPALRDYGVMVRDRLAQIHGHFGFILPVYVIVTQCDRLRGFEAFALSLPESLRDTMLGWSNDRTPDAVRDALAGDLSALDRLAFNSDWIAEDMASLEGSLSAAQVGLLASSASPGHAASLMFFSGELERLSAPLAQVLDEAFRTNQYYGSSLFRGFYLCGSTAPLGGGTAFARHLLHRKVFRERGLAIPRPEVAVSRLRGRLAALAVCAVLAVGLAVGTAWSYGRLREAWTAYSRVLTTGAALTGDQPGTSLQERMVKRRAFLEQALEIKRGRIAEVGTRIFMPASIPTERQLSTVVRGVFAGLLDDLRAGLEDKWEQWLRSATFGPGDRLGPLGPDLKETAPHKAVDRFADDYQRFVENYERHERLGRTEGAGDLAAAGGILEYLTGVGLSATTLAPSLARSVREVRTATIDCRLFVAPETQASLVAMRASDLLMQFRTVSFDDVEGDDVRWRNVVAGASRFKAGWTSITDATADDRTLDNLIDDAAKLADAVKAWAAFRGPSRALAIPAFGKPPFKQRPPSEGFCDALRPDLSAEMKAVDALKDQLTVRLLDDEVPPFGRLLDEGESGLVFTPGVAAFNAGLDDLRRQGFWQQLPADLAVALPANPAWRKEDIDAAQKIADAFVAYRGGAFRNLDDSYRVNVLDVIETAVAQLVSATLASSAGTGPARPTRPEDLTRLGAQLASMDRLTRWLSLDPDLGTEILGSLTRQANEALAAIDREASAGYFFSRSRNTPMTSAGIFAVWREIEGAAPAADAAKRWSAIVDEQREALRTLANQARPLVDYLSSGPSAERVRRWAAIVADVADFDQKRPGNAVNALEAVMREGVPATAPDRSCGPVGSSGEPRGNGFFDAVRNDLVAEGLRQCVEVRYASIAAEFNRLLSTRFPFSRLVDAAQEATREQVAQFVRVYEKQGGHFLGPLMNARSCRADVSAFVRSFDKAYLLLSSVAPLPAGSPASAAPGLALDVAPEFRVAQDVDNGGSQLVEWQIDVARQTLRERVPGKPATWTSGDSVSVTVRFARDSPNRPASKAFGAAATAAGVPVTVGDRTVRWDFGGDWALFRLLRAGRGAAAGLSSSTDLPPVVLGFQIPVERDPTRPSLIGQALESPFRVYMRIAVSPKDKPIPIDVDEFPYEAPIGAACPGL